MSYTKQLNDMTWSFSRIHCWEQCPYQFYLKYIEERDGESNFYAENGKAMHELFECLLKEKMDIDRCTEEYEKRFDLICETERQSIMDSTYEKCMNYLCEIEPLEEKYEVVGAELELNFKIGKYNFTGYVDCVLRNKDNGEIILVDHKQAGHFLKKNGEPLKNQEANFYAYKHQMYIYCKGLKECLGIDVNKIVWHHFKDNGQLTMIPFVQEELDNTEEWVIDCIEKIKKDKSFDAIEEFVMCKSLCDFRNDCEYKELKEEE